MSTCLLTGLESFDLLLWNRTIGKLIPITQVNKYNQCKVVRDCHGFAPISAVLRVSVSVICFLPTLGKAGFPVVGEGLVEMFEDLIQL